MNRNFIGQLSLVFYLLLVTKGYTQIPVIKATGGSGVNVNWQEEKKAYNNTDGPGFFYNDCAQELNAIRASSTLANQGQYSYGVSNVSDDDPMTAWVEGRDDYGFGESFEVKARAVNVIYNGYQSSAKSWLQNSRVKKFRVHHNNKPLCILELLDEMGAQFFDLPDADQYDYDRFNIYRFEILEVYKGTKWPDVAISEIQDVRCCFAGQTHIQAEGAFLLAQDLESGAEVLTFDLDNQCVEPSKVLRTSSQLHATLYRIKTISREILVTVDHPLFVKDEGFISLSRYKRENGCIDFEELIGNMSFLIWDESLQILVYEPLTDIEKLNGAFETYTLRSLSRGNTYITNGFISKTY
jgi:hypothetical protein